MATQSDPNTVAPATPRFTETEYYDRQVRLAELGPGGQDKLRAGKVLVVGAGGLGSPALSYLAAAGVGALGICEPDRLEASNLHRQTLYDYTEVGWSKARLAAKRLRQQNPFVTIHAHEEGLLPENALDLFAQYDLVLDCTDNFPTKFLINDAAVLSGTPAIFASIYQYEGQLYCVNRPAGGPCLRCLWPEMPEPGCVGSCAEVGVLGTVPGILGTMQAMEALKHLLGLPAPIHDSMVLVDCLNFLTQRVRLPRHENCPVCGTAPRITEIRRETYYPPEEVCVDITQWTEERLGQYRIIDIRELEETQARPLALPGYEHLPMSLWDLKHPPLEVGDAVLLCCSRGMRSQVLANRLRKLGYLKVLSVNSGWEAFQKRSQ